MTDVLFGTVDRYIADRGFGFVKNELPGKRQESHFFHIKTLNKSRPDLATSLEGGANVRFWYGLVDTPKGKQALPLTVAQLNANKTSTSPLIKQIEALWSGRDVPPSWLADVTLDLLGAERATELTRQREEAAKERLRLQKLERAEQTAKVEAERAELRVRQDAMEAEFDALVCELKPLGFRESRQVSNYIVRNKLGYKYKKISGFVTMEMEERTWEFKGGFPRDIYARLCEELGLNSQRSRARVIDFKSFEDSQTPSAPARSSAAVLVPYGRRMYVPRPQSSDVDDDIPF